MSTKKFHDLSPNLDGHFYINNRIFYLCGHQISQTTFPYSTISATSYKSSHIYLQIPLSHPIPLKPLPFLPRQDHLLSEQQPYNVLHSLYCEQPVLHLMICFKGSFKTDHSLNCQLNSLLFSRVLEIYFIIAQRLCMIWFLQTHLSSCPSHSQPCQPLLSSLARSSDSAFPGDPCTCCSLFPNTCSYG